MRRLLPFLVALLISWSPQAVLGAINAGTIWEVRTTGSDNNGCGFRQVGGTDRSNQDAAHATTTTLTTVNGTTISVSTTDYTVLASDVGNVWQITSGTATAGFYQITAVDTGTNQWTVDRSAGTAGQTAAGAMGGACLTIGTVSNGVAVAYNKIFVKTGTYTVTATTTLSASNNPAYHLTGTASTLEGYNSTRGDLNTAANIGSSNRPTISLSTNSGITALNATGTGWWIRNFIIDCNSLTTSKGIVTVAAAYLRNITVQEFTSQGIQVDGGSTLEEIEVKSGTSAATEAIRVNIASLNAPIYVHRCFVHDNASEGIDAAAGGTPVIVSHCVIANNSGASSDGLVLGNYCDVLNSVFHNNGRDGIRISGTVIRGKQIRNNIFTKNGGYGYNITTNGQAAMPFDDGNVYGAGTYANTSGQRNNADNTSENNNFGPYTRIDITLSANLSPFTNDAGNDFTLNDNIGAGRSARAAGVPGAIIGTTGTGYLDIGAFQHQDPAPAATRKIITIID